MEYTTISISKKTKRDLDKIGFKFETYDHLIKRLIRMEKENE